MSSVGKLLGLPAMPRTYEDSTRLILGKCLTGVEVECENVRVEELPNEEWAAYWKMDKDNSLRGHGKEFILKDPLFGEDLLQAIKGFCDWAIKSNLESNYRTGLHIHIDVRNLELDQLVSMAIVYCLYEKVIFRWVGADREGSIFCLPFYKAQGALPKIVQMFQSTKNMKDNALRVDRYGAFNFNALGKYGSVEWRHLLTTFDFDRIVKWINIAQSFKKYGKKNPTNSAYEIVCNLSKLGPDRLLVDIVGENLFKELWYEGAGHDVWATGLPIAQDIAVLLEKKQVWDSVRRALLPGTNKSFIKWIEKGRTDNFDIIPENPFLVPDIAHDRDLQAVAIEQLKKELEEQLAVAIVV